MAGVSGDDAMVHEDLLANPKRIDIKRRTYSRIDKPFVLLWVKI